MTSSDSYGLSEPLKTLRSLKKSKLLSNQETKPQQLVLAMTTKPISGPSAKMSDNTSEEIASILILTAAQKQQVINDPIVPTKNIIPDYIENYKQDQEWETSHCFLMDD
jgi:hypothetical protein